METVNPQVYLLTNVTSALGQALALALARTGAKLILVGRADSHAEEVVREIALAAQNPSLELQLCDLSTFSSVRNLAEIINSEFEKLDMLILNNTVYRKQRFMTVDGCEEMLAANYLGPFLLTNLLLDRLRASGSARIFNITAPTTGQLDFDDLQSEHQFNSIKAFNAARIANLLFTYELARRLENSGVTVNAVYPGLVRSEILEEAPLLNRFPAWLFALTPDRAAHDLVNVILDPEYKETRGKFLKKGMEIKPSEYFLDPSTQQRLWEVSEKLTDATWQGPNYDPTGSVAMYNNRDLPEGLIRPEDDPTTAESGVVKREK